MSQPDADTAMELKKQVRKVYSSNRVECRVVRGAFSIVTSLCLQCRRTERVVRALAVASQHKREATLFRRYLVKRIKRQVRRCTQY